MKFSKSALFSIIGILTICTTPVFTDVSAEEAEAKTAYTSDCTLPEAFMNAENMAVAMADPAKFIELMTLMSKSETMQELMNCSMDTEQWSKWASNVPDPSYKMNAAAVFMNPQVYMNWMTAMMNPQYYQTAMKMFMNPQMYMSWMTAMSNPAYYQSMYKMMDPAWQQKTSAWVMDPSNYQAALDMTAE